MTSHQRLVRTALAFLAAALFACASPSDEGHDHDAPTEAIAHQETKFDATWKPDTVVLDSVAVADSLVNPEAEDGVYRFKRRLTWRRRSPPARSWCSPA